MSLTTVIRTQIVVKDLANIEANPQVEWLRKAARIVADDNGGTVGRTIIDCAGSKTDVLVSVHTKELGGGVGLKLDARGKVHMTFDAESMPREAAERIVGEIQQAYVTMALLHATEKLGFRSTVREVRRPGSSTKEVVVEAQ